MAQEPSLPALLSALALGARSVSSLPISKNSRAEGEGDTSDGDESEDEFSFRMSLPEFSSLNSEARRLLGSLLRDALMDDSSKVESDDAGDKAECFSGSGKEWEDLSDPTLWEACADACDALLDRVGDYISQVQGDGGDGELFAKAVEGAAVKARSQAEGNYGRMLKGVVDMEKVGLSFLCELMLSCVIRYSQAKHACKRNINSHKMSTRAS